MNNRIYVGIIIILLILIGVAVYATSNDVPAPIETGNEQATTTPIVGSNSTSTATTTPPRPATSTPTATTSPITVAKPVAGETYTIGGTLSIAWTGGEKAKPVSIKLISESANFRCILAHGDICPQDMSFEYPILQSTPNDGIHVWTVSSSTPTFTTDSTGQYGKYWLQICQGGMCGITKDVFTIKR